MCQIRIKTDTPERTIGCYRLLEQCGNEGGALRVTTGMDLLMEEVIPIRRGELIRILDGLVHPIDHRFNYIMDFEKVEPVTERSAK